MVTNIINPKIKKYFEFKGKIHTYDFMDLVGFTPHEGQKLIVDAYEAKLPPSEDTLNRGKQYGVNFEFDYKFDTYVAVLGRRAGKSRLTSMLAAAELMNPYASVLLASYTLDNCDIIFRDVRDAIHKLGIELTVDRRKDRELELSNGSRITVASVENVESKLGSAVSLLILDEAKKFPRSLYEQVLAPMLGDFSPYSKTIMITSPENNWIETYYNFGQSADYPKIWSLNLPTSVNPTIPKAWLENAKKTLPPCVYEQEIEGRFTSSAGRVFNEFTRERNVRSIEDYPHFWNWIHGGCIVYHGLDPGNQHNTASVHLAYVEEIDTHFVFHTYQKNRTVTSEHARAIIDFESDVMRREPDVRYIDGAASQTAMDLAEFNLMFCIAEKPLRETVQSVNALCYQTSEVTGESKLIVLEEDNEELIRQLLTIKWKEDHQTKLPRETSGKNTGTKPFQPDLDKKTDWDLVDAVRYAIYNYTKNNMADVTILEFSGDGEEVDEFTKDLYSLGYVKC